MKTRNGFLQLISFRLSISGFSLKTRNRFDGRFQISLYLIKPGYTLINCGCVGELSKRNLKP